MKKLFALMFAFALVVSLWYSAVAEEKIDFEWNLKGTMFPLDEQVTFKVLTSGNRYAPLAKLAENKDWQSLCAATNVNFEFISIGEHDSPEARNNLQMRLLSDDYGDAIMCFYIDTLTDDDIQELGEAGIIIPLIKYMNDEKVMPFFHKNVLSNENFMRNMRKADGNVYAFYGVNETEAYRGGEALMQVNRAWLQAWQTARGVDHSPETLEEFEDMLIFFRDEDLNGNGQQDEIPYMIAQNAYIGTATLEHAMGMYGVSTKSSDVDMNIMIDNDQCYFAHTTDKYKAALKTFAKWYSEDLIWNEIFTANAETINEKFASAANNFGVVNTNIDIEGFCALLPPKIEGYTARYHIHPSVRTCITQPYAVVTEKCQRPEVFAAFMDLMYDYNNSLGVRYGTRSFEKELICKDENGKLILNVPEIPPEDIPDEECAIFEYIGSLSIDSQEMMSRYVNLDQLYGAQGQKHMLYRENNLWNPTENIWPRCSIPSDYAEEFSVQYVDTSTTLAEYRAKFITGQLDVDAEWDSFQQKLKDLGIDEMQKVVQMAYDIYLGK